MSARVQRMLDRFFQDFPTKETFDLFEWDFEALQERKSASVTSDDTCVTVVVEMPGVDLTGVDISVDGDKLQVDGQRGGKPKTSYATILLRPDLLDLEAIEAKLALGVLTVRIPRVKQPEPRKVQVQVG